jgi:hypothetical protein
MELDKKEAEQPQTRQSKLPRRSTNQLTVAEFVKISSLLKVSANSLRQHPSTESDQGFFISRTRHYTLPKNPSYSDFERGYAANIAPRYSTLSAVTQARAAE